MIQIVTYHECSWLNIYDLGRNEWEHSMKERITKQICDDTANVKIIITNLVLQILMSLFTVLESASNLGK